MSRRRLLVAAIAPVLVIAGAGAVRGLGGDAPTVPAGSRPNPQPGSGTLSGDATPTTPPGVTPAPPTATSARPVPAPPTPRVSPTPRVPPTTRVPPRPAVTGPIGPNPPPPTSRDAFTSAGRVLLRVKVQKQLPMLPNGCEVTSLSMLLAAAGAPTSKMVLAGEQPTDPRQPVFSTDRRDLREIESWGDPERNFVGNVAATYGYGIYHTPVARLLDSKLPGRARDLTGGSFQDLIRQVDAGTPVLVWTTTSLRPTDQWVTWTGPNGPVRATFNEHAVLLVGHTASRLIVNDPLSGRQETVDPGPFITAWRQLGRQALTVAPA